jgi:hypothetical protein
MMSMDLMHIRMLMFILIHSILSGRSKPASDRMGVLVEHTWKIAIVLKMRSSMAQRYVCKY